MKVILLQDVSRVGKRYEIKEVPDGHALNMLIPKGLVEPATKENVKRIKAYIEKIETEKVAGDEAFTEAFEALADKTITIEVDANEKGSLFKGLKAEDIVEAVKEEGVTLQNSQIALDAPIKEVGGHTVNIISGDQKGTIELEVIAKS